MYFIYSITYNKHILFYREKQKNAIKKFVEIEINTAIRARNRLLDSDQDVKQLLEKLNKIQPIDFQYSAYDADMIITKTGTDLKTVFREVKVSSTFNPVTAAMSVVLQANLDQTTNFKKSKKSLPFHYREYLGDLFYYNIHSIINKVKFKSYRTNHFLNI